MKLLITSTKIFLILTGFLLAFVGAGGVHAEMSPRDGFIKTPTGAPMVGVTVVEFTDICPSEGVMQSSYPSCPRKTDCYAERTVKTDVNGYYNFQVGTPADNEAGPYCDFLDWRRFTCSNPRVFYKIRTELPAQASGIIKTAHAVETELCPPPVQHPTTNTPAVITTNMTCPPPPACNTVCQNSSQCAIAADGCTACVEGVCKAPAACNQACERDGQCEGAKNGCTSCLPSDTGTGKVCRPAAACNVACTRDDQCAGATRDGCTSCMGGVCKKPPACNESCTDSAECAKSGSSCTECLPGDTGTGNVCRPPAACNVACTKDSQCAGARDGCNVCLGGVCKPPPACGTACTTRADCANPKDGCSECLEGTCTDYNDNMCKCDGIVADIQYPSDAFKFEAFGKVEGNDTKKAEIADITFRLTKDNQVIAKSNPITPEVVENGATKKRFKAAWQTTPPPVDKNATYRVFADVRCKPKKITASAAELAKGASIDLESQQVAVNEPVKQLPIPKGTQLLADAINQISKLFGYGNDLITKEALAQFTQTSPAPTQAQNNLQLQTLNFIKMMDTDNCRFVMWKFDETLF